MVNDAPHHNSPAAGGQPSPVPAAIPSAVDLSSLAKAISQAAEAVVITGPDARIQYVNAAFEKITGYAAAEVMGENPRVLKSGQHDAAFYQNLWACLRAGQTWRGRFVNRRKDASIYEEDSSISPVFDEQGQLIHFVAVKRDITWEREIEKRALQTQKMEAVGRLAGSMAHDFNNLLTAITGFASMALQGLPPNSEAQDDIEQILGASRRAANLTRKLLTFSRRQVAQERVLNINDAVTETALLLRPLLGASIELVLLPDENAGMVWADPAELSQALLNLATNAKDAMPAGGKLTIATSRQVLAPDPRHPAAEELVGPCVLLSVRDTGCGMTSEVKEHLFEPFFTTKVKSTGTGLGLATVYGIVKQAGGIIRVHSEPGKGTTFDVYLPQTSVVPQAVAEPAAPAAPAAQEVLEGHETILLAEDEPALLHLAARILRRNGYTVLEAGNGEEALRLFRKHQGRVDLLVTDVIMPMLGGMELAIELRLMQPNLGILFISGYTDELFVSSADLRVGTFFLQKPFTQQILLRSLRQALDATRNAAP